MPDPMPPSESREPLVRHHRDADQHVLGQSRYVDDEPAPEGMLHAAVFGSPIAHGEVTELDVAATLEAPGVAAVLVAEDIPAENQIGPLIPDEELLASSTVHFVGQPMVLVLADDPDRARAALATIRCSIEPLPVITDPRQAFDAGEIIGEPQTLELGDVESAWERCDVVVEGTCDIAGQEHVYLETQRARAIPLEGRQLRVHTSTQSPYAAQRAVARILGLPHHAVEIDVKRLGGGFGGKEDQATPWACLAALGAWRTGRPVELVLRRDEDLRMTGKRHPYLSDFKLGLLRDGTILAFEACHFQNSGAAADLSPPVLARTLFHSTNAYRIPNVRLFGACCRTHLPPNTAFRGFGGPQGMFVIESALAKAAETLGIRREEIQRRNLICDDDLFPYGQRVLEGRAERTWDEAVEEFDLPVLRREVERFNDQHYERKRGYSVMPICFGISFTATFMNQAGALIHVYTDGSVSVTTGGIEMGQGLATNLIVIVARAFGIRPERIKIESTNTTRIANMSASAASATTLLNGNAALMAVRSIRGRLEELMAEKLGLPDSAGIQIVDEQVLANGHETGWTWERLVDTAYRSRVALSAHEHFKTPNIWFDEQAKKGRPFAYHVFGTAITEVTVDCLLGTYTVDAVRLLHDLGRPLVETIDRGQIEGGLAQGLGWMTMEDLRFDPDTGRLLSGALATYKVPDVYSMPETLDVRFLEGAGNPLGPFHSKAVGEPPLMYGIGVFFALRYAMRAYRPADYPFASPLTPERLLTQLYADRLEGWIRPETEEADAEDAAERPEAGDDEFATRPRPALTP